MPRAILSPTIADTIRNIRLQKKIQAKQLAKIINKSPAFISKLENGTLNSIDTDELFKLLNYLAGDESANSIADQIYSSLELRYSEKEINEFLWFKNYDTVECRIPIPDILIDDINSRIESLGISREYLLSRINANESIPEEDKLDDAIPYNQWYQKRHSGVFSSSIKILLTKDEMNLYLDKKGVLAPYVFVQCILFYLNKIEKYGEETYLSKDQSDELMDNTVDELNANKFRSIAEKHRLISQKRNQSELKEALNSFDTENIEIINEVIQGFQFASEHDIISTNKQLDAFRKNMHWDLAFMLKLISLDYVGLEHTSISNRKKILEEIADIIKRYKSLPKEENRLENY